MLFCNSVSCASVRYGWSSTHQFMKAFVRVLLALTSSGLRYSNRLSDGWATAHCAMPTKVKKNFSWVASVIGTTVTVPLGSEANIASKVSSNFFCFSCSFILCFSYFFLPISIRTFWSGDQEKIILITAWRVHQLWVPWSSSWSPWPWLRVLHQGRQGLNCPVPPLQKSQP